MMAHTYILFHDWLVYSIRILYIKLVPIVAAWYRQLGVCLKIFQPDATYSYIFWVASLSECLMNIVPAACQHLRRKRAREKSD